MGLVENDEQVEQVEKVMLEKGITNHEVAADYWKYMNQSAAPTPTGYNPSAIGKFDLSAYWKNPVQGARNEAARALSDLRRNTTDLVKRALDASKREQRVARVVPDLD